ncbi:hypothetical protein K504DRAFT_474097 [Pleomassaria siparia CBS 279.74]|uniref:Protein HRI1 n=1 Tax=Pleomassaria siparia CBS 279.74 TaxID=1314801 RepID=A0A6G1JSF0_9PLEO|nr:hypothetical protein K504DRAFT_474097 [Pleomassaria siparia CBS 279.74]
MPTRTTPQVLKRVSMRWLPDPAFENTHTLALNVGGYFMDLRIATAENTLEWSRAGERKELSRNPLTCQWTRIIDSLGSTNPDEAAFKDLPNGDDLEFGTFSKDGVPTSYEEIWRDVTTEFIGDGDAWILQSGDGSTFLGKVGGIFLGMRQTPEGSFAVRKEVLSDSKGGGWKVEFESGAVEGIPRALDAVDVKSDRHKGGVSVGEKIRVGETEFIVRGAGKIQ